LADTRSGDCAGMTQVGSQVLKFRHSLFYFPWVGETGSHAPPYPGHAARRGQLARQLRDHMCVIVCVEERQGERHLLPSRGPGTAPMTEAPLLSFHQLGQR
jgi:hypothetical protein